MSVADKISALDGILSGCVDGKAAIAQAITAKGVPTFADASFDTMAANVGIIDGGGGDVITEDVLVSTFSNYERIYDFFKAYPKYIDLMEQDYVVSATFNNNGAETRAGIGTIASKRYGIATITGYIDVSAIVNRIGSIAGTSANGVNVYPGCTIRFVAFKI